MKRRVSEKIERISDGILAMAGIHGDPVPGTIAAGVSKAGKNIFTNAQSANSTDIRAGAALGHVLAAFVTPFHVLSKKEMDAFEKLISATTNPRLYAALDKANVDRNGEAFAVTVMKALGVPTSHALAVTTAVKLYDHWGVMSPAQKSIALVAMAIQIHKTDKGGAICDLKIIDGPGQVFTVKNALDMLQKGQNPYPLVQNWCQIYKLARAYTPNPTLEGMMDFAVSHHFLGKGLGDGAVPGVTKEGLAKAGAKPTPQYGVGAVAVPTDSQTPEGYTDAVQSPTGKVVVPKANAQTSVGALDGSLVGTKAGDSGISSDAVGVYKKWQKTDSKAVDKGADGGSALLAGLASLKGSDPYLYSILISFLAQYSHKNIDSTNPAQYAAALVGIALARLVTGKAESAADKEGAALAQSVTSSTPADFAKLQVNMRALYAHFGISSRADAYQLSNQAYSEGRIDESDLVAMHEMFDLVYGQNSIASLPKLLLGKDKGMELVRNPAPEATNHMTEGHVIKHKLELQTLSKEEVQKRNAARYAQKAQTAPAEAPIPVGAA